jgi:4-hydroxy-tetrahydrodipicolinate synthase
MQLSGVYTAVITPFTPKGKLDVEGLRRNLRFQVDQGVNGVVILGTTGESPTLNAAERKQIIQQAVAEINGKIQLLVGTGHYATEQAILQTQQAQEYGADVALVVTPYYNKPTQEGLYQHFSALCQATSIPICVYNIQGRTGQNIQTQTLRRIASHQNIIGVKEASGSISQINDVLEVMSQHASFSVLSGDDALTLPLMALGGQGVISVVSNLVPKAVCALVKAAQAGNFTQAREWHYQLSPLFKSAFIETNPIPIKAAMQLCGMAAGPCRLPLCDLDPASYEILKQVVQTLPSSWLGSYG